MTRIRQEWVAFHGRLGLLTDAERILHGHVVAHCESLRVGAQLFVWQHGHWLATFGVSHLVCHP